MSVPGDVPSYDPFEQVGSEHTGIDCASSTYSNGFSTLAVNGGSALGARGPPSLGDSIDANPLAGRDVLLPGALATLRGHSSAVSTVAWSPDGRSFVTGSSAHTACIWQSGGPNPWQWKAVKTLRGFADGFHDGYRSIAWSPDGLKLAAVGAGDSTARVWQCSGADIRQWELAGVLGGHSGPLWVVAWSPSGRSLLTAGDDRAARVWQASRVDPRQWELVAILRAHQESVRAAAWSPDSKQVLIGSADATASIWRPHITSPGWYMAQTLSKHAAPVQAVSWSPSGAAVVTAGEDGCCIWHVGQTDAGEETWWPTGLLGKQYGTVLAAAWSPDGFRLATAGVDCVLRVWGQIADEQADSWELFTALEGHRNTIGTLAWSPDGARILTGSVDHTSRLWDVPC